MAEFLNPLFMGRYLFTIYGCGHCSIPKSFMENINAKLKPTKRIIIKDCTNLAHYGISFDPIINLYSQEIDGFPTLIFEGEKIEGAESVIEYLAWIKERTSDDFIYPEPKEYLPTINSQTGFSSSCKKIKGRLFCDDE